MPINGYPFVIYIDPEWLTKTQLSDSDDASEQQ